MDVPTLKLVYRPILTVTSVCNTEEKGDTYYSRVSHPPGSEVGQTTKFLAQIGQDKV